ncbi:BRCT domain-containing protein [Verrucomicrobiales bacterium BCK34]|nr:BRCT domain-containing protein [Verrucomicrobiales bacterium BCK34]
MNEYFHFTKKQRIDKAVHTLTGLLRGVAIDDQLNAAEISEILNWANEHRDLVARHPFSELIPALDKMMEDGVIDPEEQEDLLWLCKNLTPESNYFNEITHDIQQLHGILHGILADDIISTEEARRLKEWIDDNEQMKGTYPYDELDSLLLDVLKDGRIDSEEESLLKAFFEDFFSYSFAKRIHTEIDRVKSKTTKLSTLPGVCSNCPEIEFQGRTFTFTGQSIKGRRANLVDSISKLGGLFSSEVTQKTEFLVIGAAGNPCWAFSCYGRKVEKAVEYRKAGKPIVIVHENDFWDAVEDYV